jgi:hypothetical protein
MHRGGAIRPMTLGNMRANGVRSLLVYCSTCPRAVVFNVDGFPEAACTDVRAADGLTGCGMIGADARPNWTEHRPSGAWR